MTACWSQYGLGAGPGEAGIWVKRFGADPGQSVVVDRARV